MTKVNVFCLNAFGNRWKIFVLVLIVPWNDINLQKWNRLRLSFVLFGSIYKILRYNNYYLPYVCAVHKHFFKLLRKIWYDCFVINISHRAETISLSNYVADRRFHLHVCIRRVDALNIKSIIWIKLFLVMLASALR